MSENRTYRLMIIDDEETVRMGIKDLINWSAEGFSICAEGKDGKEGLSKLLHDQPELVLVDIKMPGLNGIELVRAARNAGFSGHFIILTGYSEFEFAKAAISLDVREFLLKPIDEDELLVIVRHIFKELEMRQKELRYRLDNERIAREEMLRRILLKIETEESINKRFSECKLELPEGKLCVGILAEKENLIDKEVIQALKLEDSVMEMVVMDQYIIVIGWGMNDKILAHKLMEKCNRFYRRFERKLLVSVGCTVARWNDMPHSFEAAHLLLENAFLFSQHELLTVELIEKIYQEVENPTLERLCTLMEIGDLEGIEENVFMLGIYCAQELMKEMEIKLQITHYLIEIKNWVDQKYESAKNVKLCDVLEEIKEIRELNQLLKVFSRILQELARNICCDASANVAKRMYYYMEHNYEKDLKLEVIAKIFSYNSNYLGKIFRKEMGDSFNNALDTIRIAKAKELLVTTEQKVYQISGQVGYGNIDYFYLKFKKIAGISPKEYRRIAKQGPAAE